MHVVSHRQRSLAVPTLLWELVLLGHWFSVAITSFLS